MIDGLEYIIIKFVKRDLLVCKSNQNKKKTMSRTIKKSYTKSKAFDKSCSCHGGCPYCLGNKEHRHRKREERVNDLLREWKNKEIENETKINND